MCSSRKYPYSLHRLGIGICSDKQFVGYFLLSYDGQRKIIFRIGISWGMGSSGRSKNIKKCMKLYWTFQRGVEVLEKKSLPWGRYGYFLEVHNVMLKHPSLQTCPLSTCQMYELARQSRQSYFLNVGIAR